MKGLKIEGNGFFVPQKSQKPLSTLLLQRDRSNKTSHNNIVTISHSEQTIKHHYTNDLVFVCCCMALAAYSNWVIWYVIFLGILYVSYTIIYH